MHVNLYINWSKCILGGLNYYVLTSKDKYNVLIVFILYCITLLLLLRWIRVSLGTGLLVYVGLREG